jgi:hypothetical protein
MKLRSCGENESDKLLRTKDFPDVLRMHTEFLQTQQALTEQSKEFCETVREVASDVARVTIQLAAIILA